MEHRAADALLREALRVTPDPRWTYDWACSRESPQWQRSLKTWPTVDKAAEAARKFSVATYAYLGRAAVIQVVQA